MTDESDSPEWISCKFADGRTVLVMFLAHSVSQS